MGVQPPHAPPLCCPVPCRFVPCRAVLRCAALPWGLLLHCMFSIQHGLGPQVPPTPIHTPSVCCAVLCCAVRASHPLPPPDEPLQHGLGRERAGVHWGHGLRWGWRPPDDGSHPVVDPEAQPPPRHLRRQRARPPLRWQPPPRRPRRQRAPALEEESTAVPCLSAWAQPVTQLCPADIPSLLFSCPVPCLLASLLSGALSVSLRHPTLLTAWNIHSNQSGTSFPMLHPAALQPFAPPHPDLTLPAKCGLATSTTRFASALQESMEIQGTKTWSGVLYGVSNRGLNSVPQRHVFCRQRPAACRTDAPTM